MDDNNNNSSNPVMPPDSAALQGSENQQQDLFTVAPPPAGNAAQTPPAVVIRPDLSRPEQNAAEPGSAVTAPVLTNESRTDGKSESKPPLVFSDGHPLPSRDGGRELAPAREKKYTAPVRRGTVHLSSGDFSPDASFGDLLTQAREKSGLSREQVRQITKLNAGYLSALEDSDLAKLPPPVYVSAYIRTLADLYGLDGESTALVREKLNAAAGTGAESGDVPSALIQSLEKDAVINEKEDKRLRKIFWFSAAGLAVLLILIIGVIIAALLHGSGDPAGETSSSGTAAAGEPAGMEEPAGKPEFTRAEFDALTMPQVPEASTLKMSRKRAIMPQ